MITGDIVGFSKLPEKQRRMLSQIMKNASKAVRRNFRRSVPLDLDVFRGDSWQLLISDAGLSLRIAIFLRAYLRAHAGIRRFDTRMAIAIGTVDFVTDDRVSKGDGQAYRYSGNALEQMPKSSYMCFHFPSRQNEESLNVLVQLMDVLATNWSGRQSLAITGALQGLKQEKIGSLWEPSITQQSVNRHLQRAGWFAVEKGIKFFEKQFGSAVS